jgi:hypothetical protein
MHFESTTDQPTDAGVKTITQAGFDLSGVDFLMLGTLYKNITFGLVPTLDADGTTGLEAAFVRFDNLGSSPWANLKVGKFELDNLLSEKRFTWLSNNGGFLYSYHYQPAGSVDNYAFGLGDNQIGAEFSGHSINSYTRFSLSLLTTDDGEPGLPSGKSITVFFYDGPIAKAFAFEGGLASPEELLHRLEGGFHTGRTHEELLNVAVDGETFGHHKKGGDEVLAAALAQARRLQAQVDEEVAPQHIAVGAEQGVVEIEERQSHRPMMPSARPANLAVCRCLTPREARCPRGSWCPPSPCCWPCSRSRPICTCRPCRGCSARSAPASVPRS